MTDYSSDGFSGDGYFKNDAIRPNVTTDNPILPTGYLAPGVNYLQEPTTIVYDPTGALLGNLVFGETTSPVTEPDIWTLEGPFYQQGLTVTGVLSSGGAPQELVPFLDYTFSPLYGKMTDQIGLPIYSYLLLTNTSNWASVTTTYQAVGCARDAILLQEIVDLGTFDRTNLTVWEGLVGDSIITTDDILPDVLTNGETVYILSKKLNTLAAQLQGPNVYKSGLEALKLDVTNELSILQSTVNSLSATVSQYLVV
jgi:hypothetical protein